MNYSLKLEMQRIGSSKFEQFGWNGKTLRHHTPPRPNYPQNSRRRNVEPREKSKVPQLKKLRSQPKKKIDKQRWHFHHNDCLDCDRYIVVVFKKKSYKLTFDNSNVITERAICTSDSELSFVQVCVTFDIVFG